MFWDTWRGVKNLIWYFPVIWRDSQWDWTHITEILGRKLEYQAKFTYENGIHVGAEKDAKRMRVCVELCKRLSEEDYSNFGHRTPKDIVENGVNQDLDMLFTLMRKHIRCWWN